MVHQEEIELKKITRATTASLVALTATMAAGAADDNQKEKFTLEPCFVDGIKNAARCATVQLPLNYDDPDGKQIPIFVAVVPSSTASPETDAFIVFSGGPGQASAEQGAFVDLAFDEILGKRDVILIDQRGTGKSYALSCNFDPIEDADIEPKAAAEKCRSQQDIDVRHFTLENIIRDTEEIRARLGYDQLNLWGGSYGTKTASLYLKRYPERVRSVVVDGVLPPDTSLFSSAPASAERALNKLIEDCSAQTSCNQAFPDIKAQVNALVEKASNGELRFKGLNPVTGVSVDIEMSIAMTVESIRSVMYNAEGTTILPFAINEASNGNLQPLVAGLFGAEALSNGMYLGSTLSLLCGEDVSSIGDDAAAAAGAGSFARDSYYKIWNEYCEGWDYIVPSASDFYGPAEGDVPMLVLSGDLDPVTPPALGEHWVKGFPNGRHIVVKGTGHNTSYVACMPSLISEFVDNLDAAALDTSCLDHLARLPLVISANGNVQ